MDIKLLSVDEFFDRPEADILLSEYAVECGISGLPTPKPDVALYRMIEAAGAMKIYAAFDDDGMTGFINLLVTRNPHYSAVLGTIESIFVLKGKRSNGGVGLALLRKARKEAQALGAVGLLVSAPAGSSFEAVMNKMDAKKTNEVFFWSFAQSLH